MLRCGRGDPKLYSGFIDFTRDEDIDYQYNPENYGVITGIENAENLRKRFHAKDYLRQLHYEGALEVLNRLRKKTVHPVTAIQPECSEMRAVSNCRNYLPQCVGDAAGKVIIEEVARMCDRRPSGVDRRFNGAGIPVFYPDWHPYTREQPSGPLFLTESDSELLQRMEAWLAENGLSGPWWIGKNGWFVEGLFCRRHLQPQDLVGNLLLADAINLFQMEDGISSLKTWNRPRAARLTSQSGPGGDARRPAHPQFWWYWAGFRNRCRIPLCQVVDVPCVVLRTDSKWRWWRNWGNSTRCVPVIRGPSDDFERNGLVPGSLPWWYHEAALDRLRETCGGSDHGWQGFEDFTATWWSRKTREIFRWALNYAGEGKTWFWIQNWMNWSPARKTRTPDHHPLPLCFSFRCDSGLFLFWNSLCCWVSLLFWRSSITLSSSCIPPSSCWMFCSMSRLFLSDLETCQ